MLYHIYPSTRKPPNFSRVDKWFFWAFGTGFRLGQSREATGFNPWRLIFEKQYAFYKDFFGSGDI
ncbi:MAG: hypothetical protein UW22_C0032G0016 [Candidatus Gottesmanbacteria bacterium GW2011_GWB1_44_11c]|uniref:Uncharacterized protein n=1 Tax=Candidatus Gottesmanbacteria bacterium GW2011_GWB1_44_11c TaxID=1618447 RepID=A0A0G1GS20_9BACT|nr:MAG: hypothetical protein UW22_C0032G0016 [Candidatus Gottesmanbacteria bacterium GW2011_GWB1_44_11c]HCM82372.1 hypothetical protein [Patescibacteria group bacterium]